MNNSKKPIKSNKDMILDCLISFFHNRPEVIAVYLFGSYSQGREKAFSDIDLGLLLKSNMLSRRNELIKTYIVQLAKRLRKDFHIVIMNTAGEIILSQIFSKGHCIFIRNSKVLSYFKMLSYSKIADFGFYRRPMENALLSRILGTPK
jgi:predicted nucleotidyltransferase